MLIILQNGRFDLDLWPYDDLLSRAFLFVVKMGSVTNHICDMKEKYSYESTQCRDMMLILCWNLTCDLDLWPWNDIYLRFVFAHQQILLIPNDRWDITEMCWEYSK